jgi:hypothetical protein
MMQLPSRIVQQRQNPVQKLSAITKALSWRKMAHQPARLANQLEDSVEAG